MRGRLIECVCLCERERERKKRETERQIGGEIEKERQTDGKRYDITGLREREIVIR